MIYSTSVQNVLDRIYLSAVTMGKAPIEYANCINALHKIEHGTIRTLAQKPISWARDGLYVAKSGRYWFGYTIQNDVVIVEEVYDCITNRIIWEQTARRFNRIRLTESKIRKIVEESVRRILKEYYNLEKYGTWNVVEGTHLLQIAKGLEDWGELSDERLYDDGNHNGYMIFKICDGMGKNQGICAKLMFDNGDSYYKALKKNEIPQDILQDLNTKRFS